MLHKPFMHIRCECGSGFQTLVLREMKSACNLIFLVSYANMNRLKYTFHISRSRSHRVCVCVGLYIWLVRYLWCLIFISWKRQIYSINQANDMCFNTSRKRVALASSSLAYPLLLYPVVPLPNITCIFLKEHIMSCARVLHVSCCE